MNREELGRRIYEVANIRGQFTLRSGEQASEYFDKFQFESDPVLLRAIAGEMATLLPAEYDQLAGLELGGIPLATALSLQTGKPVLFVRKEQKRYGTCKLAEGGDVAGSRLVIIEDVVTSGGAIIEQVEALRAMGATIAHACAVVDREGAGRQKLESLGLEFSALFTRSELESMAARPE